MRKSPLFRRIALLPIVATLLSATIAFIIYIFVAQSVFADMRAGELTPIARTIARMMAETRRNGLGFFGVWSLLERGNRGFGADLRIYDADGESIMNAVNRDIAARSAVDETEIRAMIDNDLLAALSGVETSGIREAGFGGSYLVVGVPIESSVEGEGVLGAVFFTQTVTELGESRRSLNITLLISSGAALLIMAFPAYIAARRLVAPVRQMRDVAMSLAKGDLSARANESQEGEIGDLARAINLFAQESSRMEQTRRDYVANVSHELRTPIASIRAIGETLRDGMAKTEEKRTLFYGSIVRESMRLSRLVDDLLELSRLQAGSEAMAKSAFDLREPLGDVAATYGRVAKECGKKFCAAVDMSSPMTAFGNADRAEQILVILLDNACKYASPGGRIELLAKINGGNYEVSVKNEGRDIEEEDLRRLFERFYKADKSHSAGGSGLGLSIAREIVKALGEDIWVKSEGGTTIFTFTVSAATQSELKKKLIKTGEEKIAN